MLITPALAAWPERPVTMVVPYAAGGGTDIVGREFAQLLQERIGQPVVIENRGGAGGHVGTMLAARAKPDGYTLLYAVNSNIVINPSLYRTEGLDFTRDLIPPEPRVPLLRLAGGRKPGIVDRNHGEEGLAPYHPLPELGVPEGHEPLTMAAVGYRGDPATLPERLRERELAARTRKPLDSFVFGARWGAAMDIGGRETGVTLDTNAYTETEHLNFTGGKLDVWLQDSYAHLAARKYLSDAEWAAYRSRVEEAGGPEKRGDIASLLNEAHADVQLDIFAPPEFKWIRHAKGLDELRRAVELNFDSVEHQRPEISNVIAQGDSVVLIGRERGTIRATSEPYDVQFVHKFTFRDGRLTAIRIVAAKTI